MNCDEYGSSSRSLSTAILMASTHASKRDSPSISFMNSLSVMGSSDDWEYTTISLYDRVPVLTIPSKEVHRLDVHQVNGCCLQLENPPMPSAACMRLEGLAIDDAKVPRVEKRNDPF